MTIPHYFIAGLGNYSWPVTRHSVGQLVVEELAKRFSVSLMLDKDTKCWSGTTEVSVNPQNGGETITSATVTFVKPRALMNVNGKPIAKAVAKRYGVPPPTSRLIILHDSLEHRPMTCSPKHTGSAEGHNGVRSVIYTFHNLKDFTRLRLGIGRGDKDPGEYVLGRLSQEEINFWSKEGLDLVWKHIQQRISKTDEILE